MTTKKTVEKKKAPKKSKAPYTHIDRSNGMFLRDKDLDRKKPWIGPVSRQATVEKLTEEERDELK